MLRVLELGAGMAALPSLALAVLGRYFKKWNEQQQEGESLGMYPEIHVTITDGHPKAVANNVACIQRTMGGDGKDNNCSIHCCPLLWKRNEQGRKECQELLDRTTSMVDDNHDDDDYNKNVHQDNSYDDGFDLILVSDCLHFTDFHVDLAMTIGRLLRVGGVCILCQPARGSSVERFLQLIQAMNGTEPTSSSPLFQVDLHYRYHSDLYEKHVRFMNEQDECYIPDIHYPLWLELKKVGNFCEEYHGDRAINFVHDKRNMYRA
jgi:SAM-dependent methyltransferase